MLAPLAAAALSAITAGAAAALYTTWRRMEALRGEVSRLRASLARRRPAGISIREEGLRAELLALAGQLAPEAAFDDASACLSFLGRAFEDQRRACAEYRIQLDRLRGELLQAHRRLEETRSALNQLRIRRGSSEAQLGELERALAAAMAERDQLRWQLRALSPEGALKLAG